MHPDFLVGNHMTEQPTDRTSQNTTTQGRIRQKVDMLVMNLQTAAVGGMTEDECKMVLRGALEIQALLPA